MSPINLRNLLKLVTPLFILVSCDTDGNNSSNNTEKLKPHYVTEQLSSIAVGSMRIKELKVTPKDLEIELPSEPIQVYGVLMDLNLGMDKGTVVAYANGYASMHLSSSLETDSIVSKVLKNESIDYIQTAQGYLNKCNKVNIDTIELPTNDDLNVFLLTNQGIYFNRIIAVDSLEWKPLIESGANVWKQIIENL